MSKVSVIVPVHNTATFLPRCVNSLTAQNLTDIEIILVENCSTDNSLEVCHQLAQKDSRIKVISIDKGDPSIARNEGVNIATGDYVGFVDSDDFIAPEMYEEMYNLAIEHDLGLVNCTFHMQYDDGSRRYRMPNDGVISILSAKEMTILNLNDKVSKVYPTLLVRRELFEGFTIPSAMYFEDRASTHLLAARATRSANINKAYYSYFSRGNSRMHVQHENFKRMYDFIRATYWRLEFIRDTELFADKERIDIFSRCAEQYIRKLRHLLRLGKTDEERAATVEYCRRMDTIIPKQVRLPLRARAIRWYIRMFVI